MKKILSHKLIIVAAAVLVCTLTTGIGITSAAFSDKNSGESTKAKMATVDIELQDLSFNEENGAASFTVVNKSNIGTYLRAGIILELVSENMEPVTVDTGGISIAASGSGWAEEQRHLTENSITFTKWFLKYGDASGYTKAEPGENFTAEFMVSNIPENCRLIVNVVPEVVQADVGGDALWDFQYSGDINLPW